MTVLRLFMLGIVVLNGGLGQTKTDDDICVLDSCLTSSPSNSSLEKSCSESKGLAMRGRCCVKLSDMDDIMGVDLSFCNITSLNKLLFQQAPKLQKLNLTFNPHLHVDNETFRGLKDLRSLSLPKSVGCPGNWTLFNSTWEAWSKTEMRRSANDCFNQTDTCSLLEANKYTCPENSVCANYGPGLFRCNCMPGWAGYKCLRLDHHRPSIAIVCGSAGAAIVISAALWFSERKYVIGGR